MGLKIRHFLGPRYLRQRYLTGSPSEVPPNRSSWAMLIPEDGRVKNEKDITDVSEHFTTFIPTQTIAISLTL